MGTRERKERERDEMRELILQTANEIMTAEGLDSVSIRKIANKIEYSPAIIYHYFKDKDDIINHLMKKGYQRIIDALASTRSSSDEPAQKLREITRKYIEVALQMSDDYRAVQLNNSPGILEFTSSLFESAADKKPALKILFQCLKDIYKDKDIDDSFIELTAQVIAAATFGLVIRLNIEKDIISQAQKEKLIEHYIKVTVDGMVLGNSLDRIVKGGMNNA